MSLTYYSLPTDCSVHCLRHDNVSMSPSRLVHAKLLWTNGAITPHETTAGDDDYRGNKEQDEQEDEQVFTAQPPEE